MPHIMPTGAPNCWGTKYQDGEKECVQCRFNDTCRPAMLDRVVYPNMSRPQLPPPPPLVNIRPAYPPPPPAPVLAPSQAMVPMPQKPFYPPSVPQNAAPLVKPAPIVTTSGQVVNQANHYYQQSTGYSLPNMQQPNPMMHWHRPGAPGPGYYFTQYPGESVTTRIAKNAVLRVAEALFAELMQFFRHYTWPPTGAQK